MTQRLSAEPGGRPTPEHLTRGHSLGGASLLIGCVLLLWAVLAAAANSTIAAVGAILMVGMAVYLLVLSLAGRGATADRTGVLERAATPVVVAAMFFAPLNDVRPMSAVSVVTMTDALLVVGFGLLAPVLLTRKLTLPKSYVIGWALLLPAGLVASALAVNPTTSFINFARLITAALVLPVAFVWWRPRRRVVVWLASAYVVGAAVSVVAAVIEGPVGAESRHDGLTTHSNFLGHTAVIAVCLAIFVLSQQPVHRRWIFYGLILVCGYGVWISGSRASFVALVIVAVLYPLIERSMFAAGGVLFGGAVTLLFWSQLASSGDSALRRLIGTSHSATSDQHRRASMEAALDDFLARPFTGNGFEHALVPHNIYLQLAATAGIIGLLGFLFIITALVAPLFTAHRLNHRLAYPAMAYLVIGALDKNLWDRFIWVGVLLALLVMVLPDRHPAEDRSLPPPTAPDLVGDRA